MKESIMREPGTTRTKDGFARLTIEIPEKGLELITKIAELYGITVDEEVWKAVKVYINGELETDLGYILGTGQFDTTHRRKLVSPEAVSQEVQI